MNCNHERNMSFSRHRKGYAPDAPERMAVNDRNIVFSPKRRNQIKRHQIATHRNQLLLPLFRHSQYRHKSPKSLHLVATRHEWIFDRPMLQPRTIDNWIHTMLTQSFEEALDG